MNDNDINRQRATMLRCPGVSLDPRGARSVARVMKAQARQHHRIAEELAVLPLSWRKAGAAAWVDEARAGCGSSSDMENHPVKSWSW